ncbi:MAG TPA: phenylalanine--tRNA ligase subunit alpha, partial [Terriglobales bacterium]|nr:phenylalanine--tRNA ligase subunit alpha [Terriglobales bacterium]
MYSIPKLDDYSSATLDRAASELKAALEQESSAVSNEADWKVFRDRWMARKGGITTQLSDWLKAAPGAAKREVGMRVNDLKARIEQAVEAAQQRITSARAGVADRVDITLPGIRRSIGAEHPVIRTVNEIVSVFKAMGYSVAEGPEIETDYYNFESLNFPPN